MFTTEELKTLRQRLMADGAVTVSVDLTPGGLHRAAEMLKRSQQAGCNHEGE